MTTLRLATRQSPLALWQAEAVKSALSPKVLCHLQPMRSTGDVTPGDLSTIGGKALFASTLQQALLNQQADIAVHSVKDLSVIEPTGLMLAAVLPRADARDVLISHHGVSLTDLPEGAVVGTGSPRRRAQCLAIRPDLSIKLLRGNIATRLQQWQDKKYDAILMAAAALIRLDMTDKISSFLSTDDFLPAIAQGVIGVECRCDDHQSIDILSSINHVPTQICVQAEQTVNRVLQGGCDQAIAAYAFIESGILFLRAMVGDDTGRQIDAHAQTSIINMTEATRLGHEVADALLDQGARDLL